MSSGIAPFLAANQRGSLSPGVAAQRRGGDRQPPGYLEELKARNDIERQNRLVRLAEWEGVKIRSRLEQQARTTDRIGRLFPQSPPIQKRAPEASSSSNSVQRERQASSSVESRALLTPRRGKGAKYYGV